MEQKEVCIPIGGMTCAARVERTTRKLNGIAQSSVNYATEKATITYNPSEIRLSKITHAILKAGYTPNQVDHNQLRKQKEIRTLWTKWIIAAMSFSSISVLINALRLNHFKSEK